MPAVRPGHYSGADYRIDESVGYLLRVATSRVTRDVEARMAAHGLTDAQWKPLLLIAHGMGRCGADLAREIGYDTGALTRMIDRLEGKGLVRRSRSPEDRRIVHLELTPEGERAAAMVPYVLADVLNGHFNVLNAEELRTFKSLLRRVIDAAPQAGQDNP